MLQCYIQTHQLYYTITRELRLRLVGSEVVRCVDSHPLLAAVAASQVQQTMTPLNGKKIKPCLENLKTGDWLLRNGDSNKDFCTDGTTAFTK